MEIIKLGIFMFTGKRYQGNKTNAFILRILFIILRSVRNQFMKICWLYFWRKEAFSNSVLAGDHLISFKGGKSKKKGKKTIEHNEVMWNLFFYFFSRYIWRWQVKRSVRTDGGQTFRSGRRPQSQLGCANK